MLNKFSNNVNLMGVVYTLIEFFIRASLSKPHGWWRIFCICTLYMYRTVCFIKPRINLNFLSTMLKWIVEKRKEEKLKRI